MENYKSIPMGCARAKAIYDAVIGAETDYKVLGISATLLIIALFNGAIYGVIIWLIYTVVGKAGLIPRGKKQIATAT